MGSKHNKKRFFCVKYALKADKKYDELVTLSKKKIGPGKLNDYHIILDLINKDVLKSDLPGAEQASFEKLEKHFRKYYAEAIDNFLKN